MVAAGSSVEATWVAAFDTETSDGVQDTSLNIPGKKTKTIVYQSRELSYPKHK